MIVMALDGTRNRVTCEITDGDALVFSRSQGASSFVVDCPALVQSALLETRISPTQISLYSAVTGPGSWTGIRVATTLVRTIAYAAGRPAVGIPLLPFIASFFLPGLGTVEVMTPARAGLFLKGAFDTRETPALARSDISLIGEDEAASPGVDASQTVLFTDRNQPEIPLGYRGLVRFPDMIAAGSLSAEAARRYKSGVISDAHKLVPTYHMPFQAGPRKGGAKC